MQNSMIKFTFFVSNQKYPLGKFGLKTQNRQFKLKLDTWTNLNIQNPIKKFNFFDSTGNTLFGQSWSKKSKFSVSAKIWYLN